MILRHFIAILTVAAATAGAAQTDLAAALSGKTITSRGGSFVIGADGSLTGQAGGDAVSGTWAVRDGRWCRTITAPARLAGEACQTAVIAGDQLTLTRGDGSTVTFTIE